jgi:hypothetical protein
MAGARRDLASISEDDCLSCSMSHPDFTAHSTLRAYFTRYYTAFHQAGLTQSNGMTTAKAMAALVALLHGTDADAVADV